jgi:hypothetical protein
LERAAQTTKFLDVRTNNDFQLTLKKLQFLYFIGTKAFRLITEPQFLKKKNSSERKNFFKREREGERPGRVITDLSARSAQVAALAKIRVITDLSGRIF